jgi:hypothetical protein
MVPLTSLVLPIVLSAIIVFVASSIIHMALGYHAGDVRAVPDEDAAQKALGPLQLPPGDYVVPHAGGPAGMKKPEYIERMRKGPVVLLTVRPAGQVGMGKMLAQWFVHALVVSLFAGYLASRTQAPGAPYLEVFRVAGTSAFMGYSLALFTDSIWFWRNWGWTLRSVFGWLWPR